MENTTKPMAWSSGPSQAPLPPLVRGLPLLGSAVEMYSDVLGFLVRQYHRYGPAFRVRIPGATYPVIAGRDANLFMAREGSAHFRSKEFWEELDAEFGARVSLISSDGETHRRLRALQKRGFGKAVIERHLGEVVAITRRWLNGWQLGESRPAYPFLQNVITEQLGTIIAGTDPGDAVRDVVTFVRTALLVLVTHQRPRALLALPGYRRARQRAFALGNQILDWHRQNPPDGRREPNLIDDAIEAARQGDVITDRDLLPVALGPYIAGLDTAASTAAFLIYALLAHPDLLERAQSEADALFDGEGVTPARLQAMDVLHRVTLETLRRYPIAPAVQRTVIQPFEFAGCRIEEGQRLFIGTTVAHFLPELHPDPYRFDIDRYLPPRNEHRAPGAFAPFSLGAHTCLGAGLAEIQIMLTTATLLRAAHWDFDRPGYRLRMRTAPTPAPDNTFRLRLVERRA